MSNPTYEPNTPLTKVEAAKVAEFGLDKPETTSEVLLAQTRRRLADHPHSWLPSDVTTMRRLADAVEKLDGQLAEALAEVKRLVNLPALAATAPAEAAWRKAIADQVRRNCTIDWDTVQKGGDALVYAVCDWIENPPAWSSLTPPAPAPKTQDGEAEALEEDIHEAMLAEAMIDTRYHDGDSVEVIAESYVADVIPALARDLHTYGYRRLVPVYPEGGETK